MKTERLLVVQIIVAAIAVAVTAISFYQIGPLTGKVSKLNAEIASLEAKRDELQHSNAALSRVAKPITNPTGAVEAWLYIGRVASTDQWAPPSEGVEPSPNPLTVRDFVSVKVTKNAPLVDNIEGSSSITRVEPGMTKDASVRLVQAGTVLKVIEIKTQPSIGGASLVWAKTSVPSEKVLEVTSTK